MKKKLWVLTFFNPHYLVISKKSYTFASDFRTIIMEKAVIVNVELMLNDFISMHDEFLVCNVNKARKLVSKIKKEFLRGNEKVTKIKKCKTGWLLYMAEDESSYFYIAFDESEPETDMNVLFNAIAERGYFNVC